MKSSNTKVVSYRAIHNLLAIISKLLKKLIFKKVEPIWKLKSLEHQFAC